VNYNNISYYKVDNATIQLNTMTLCTTCYYVIIKSRRGKQSIAFHLSLSRRRQGK